MLARQIPYRPGHAGYVSEFTDFMEDVLQRHPEYIDNQHRGWSIYWDRNVDLDELKKAEKDKVPVKPYRY